MIRFLNPSRLLGRHLYRRSQAPSLSLRHFSSLSNTTRGDPVKDLRDLRPLLEKQKPESLSLEESNLLQALRNADPQKKETLQELRDCYESMGYFEYALETEKRLCDPSAESLRRQGTLHLLMDKRVLAGQALREAFNADPHDPKILTSLASWHYHCRDDCKKALSYLETASKLAEEQENTRQLVTCLQHQGFMLRNMEDFPHALERYEQALAKIADPVADRIQYRSLQLDCADMNNALEKFDAATRIYESMLQDNEDDAERSVLLHNLGKLYSRRKDDAMIPKARSALEESISIKQRLGSTPGELAKTYNALGALEAVYNKDKSVAMRYFHQCLLLVRSDDNEEDQNPLVMHALRNISLLKGERVAKWQDETPEKTVTT